MGKQRVECRAQRGAGLGAIRNVGAQELFCTGFVARRHLCHGPHHQLRRVGLGQAGAIKVPPGEDTCQAAHIFAAVGFHRVAAANDGGTVVLQLHQANGEKLHQLAGVVFVGLAACFGVGLGVAAVGEVVTHCGAQRQSLQQLAVIAKSVGLQNVEIVAQRKLAPGAVHPQNRNHTDFRQGQHHPLAQGVSAPDEGPPDRVVHTALAVPELFGVVAVGIEPGHMAGRRR